MDGWSAAFVLGVLILAVALGGLHLLRSVTWGKAPVATLRKPDQSHPTPQMKITDPNEPPQGGPQS